MSSENSRTNEDPTLEAEKKKRDELAKLASEFSKGYLEPLKNEFFSEYDEYISILSVNFKTAMKRLKESFTKNLFTEYVDVEKQSVQRVLTNQGTETLLERIGFFTKIKEEVRDVFKLFLAELLLSDNDILNDEEKIKKSKEFIEKELSIKDLERLIILGDQANQQPGYIIDFEFLKGEIIREKINIFKILHEWRWFLSVELTRKLKTQKELENYLKEAIKIYRRNLGILRANLLKSEELKNQVREELGDNPSEDEVNKKLKERVDEMIKSLRKASEIDVDSLMQANPQELEELLKSLKEFNEEFKDKREFGLGEMLNILNKSKDVLAPVLGSIFSVASLWGVALGFFFPLYLIEKMYKTIDQGAIFGRKG